jgi:hypothetical protein
MAVFSDMGKGSIKHEGGTEGNSKPFPECEEKHVKRLLVLLLVLALVLEMSSSQNANRRLFVGHLHSLLTYFSLRAARRKRRIAPTKRRNSLSNGALANDS